MNYYFGKFLDPDIHSMLSDAPFVAKRDEAFVALGTLGDVQEHRTAFPKDVIFALHSESWIPISFIVESGIPCPIEPGESSRKS